MQFITVADAAPTQGASSLRQKKDLSQQSLQAEGLATDKDDEEEGDDDDADDDVQVVSAGATTSTPAAVSLGPGGYPALPSISNLFASATETLKAVASQAQMLEERAVQAGKKDEVRLAHKKSVYELKLKRQERENRVIEKAVSQTSARIQALRLNNAAIKNHSLALRKSNHLMREELKAIQKRLETSKEFVGKSLANTDDSNAKELDVLGLDETQKSEIEVDDSEADDDADTDDDGDDTDPSPATAAPPRQAQSSPALPSVPPPVLQAQLPVNQKSAMAMKQTGKEQDEDEDSDEDGDEDADDEDEDGNETGTSFLALRTKRQATKATAASAGENILAEISANVKLLAKEERQSQQNLQASYEAAWEAGEHRHKALEGQLALLNTTEVSLLHFQDKLKAAEAHLRTTQGQLEANLHAQGLFTQRLAHLALAPAVEAPRLLEAVPDRVTLSKDTPAKAKKVALTRVMPTIVDNTPP